MIATWGFSSIAGKIDKTRKTVKQGSGRASKDNSSSGGSDTSSGDHSTNPPGPEIESSKGGLWVAGGIFCFTIGLPFCTPHWALEGPIFINPKKNKGHFFNYPYAVEKAGHMEVVKASRSKPKLAPDGDIIMDPIQDPDPVIEFESPFGMSNLTASIAPEYSYDFDNVHRPSIYAMFDTSIRLGLETGWNFLLEPLDGDELDSLVIGDINGTFRFAQSNRAEFKAGIGARLMFDGGKYSAIGFNFTYGFSVFPIKPMVFSASVDLGNLGMAFTVHGRVSVGVSLLGWEPYIGYDVLFIEPIVFHGPTAGLRKWF